MSLIEANTTSQETQAVSSSHSTPETAEPVSMEVEGPNETCSGTDIGGSVESGGSNTVPPSSSKHDSSCEGGVISEDGEGGVISEDGDGGVISEDGDGGVISEDGEPGTGDDKTLETDEAKQSSDETGATVRGERVERLKTIIKQYQDTLNRHKDISQFMSGDVLNVAEKCWQQIHCSIGTAIENKHEKIFEEFKAFEKLSDLDNLSREHKSSQPAWRPSGIPNEDHLTMSSVEAKHTLVPKYEQQYEEAKQATQDIREVLSAKQKQLSMLQETLRHKMNSLSENSDDILSNKSSSRIP